MTDSDGKQAFYMYATRGIFYQTDAGYMTIISIEMIAPSDDAPGQYVRLDFFKEDLGLAAYARLMFDAPNIQHHCILMPL